MLIATFIHISGNQDIPDSEDAGNTKSKGKMEPYQDVETPMECEQDKGVVPPKGHVIGPVPTPVRANAAPAAPSQSSDTTPKAVRKGKSKAKAKATPKKGKNQHGKKPPKASRDVSRKLAAKKIYKKKGKDDVERKLHSVAKLVICFIILRLCLLCLHKLISQRNAIDFLVLLRYTLVRTRLPRPVAFQRRNLRPVPLKHGGSGPALLFG